MKIKTQLIETIASKAIHKITLVNDFGIEASFLTLGATWQEFLVPRANGGKKNLIIGFDQPSTYLITVFVLVSQLGVSQAELIVVVLK